MSAPGWFNYVVYFENKLKQLQAGDSGTAWDGPTLQKAFWDAGYEIDGDGMYRHFLEYGNAENISPNGLLDVDYYMASKLAQMQNTFPSYTMTMLEQAFEHAHISAWDHYTQYGMYEGVNPSAGMNTGVYMSAKLTQMRATDRDYTSGQLYEAFRAAGLNPIEHWLLFGRDEKLSYSPTFPVNPPASGDGATTPATQALPVAADADPAVAAGPDDGVELAGVSAAPMSADVFFMM